MTFKDLRKGDNFLISIDHIDKAGYIISKNRTGFTAVKFYNDEKIYTFSTDTNIKKLSRLDIKTSLADVARFIGTRIIDLHNHRTKFQKSILIKGLQALMENKNSPQISKDEALALLRQEKGSPKIRPKEKEMGLYMYGFAAKKSKHKIDKKL